MSYWKYKTLFLPFIAVSLWAQAIVAAPVIEDQGVSMDREELEQVLKNLPDNMKQAAANDVGDRLELLNQAMTNKKIAMDADKLTPESDPEAYWEYYFLIQRTKQKYVFDRYMKELEVPDMAPLAEETYNTQRDKYALVEETRMGSHILFACPPGCPREQFRPLAEEVLVKLDQGARFEDMVEQYSQDEGTKRKGGRFTFFMGRGEPQISPPFLAGLFEIEEIGGYSTVVETQFGFHIIRLDEIQDSYYRPYEEIREEIIGRLEGEYRELAGKEFRSRFLLTDEVRIDGPAMKEIFAPYQTGEAQ
jgi:parvulin-like peptidyl-prolyl isomerase